jgi:DNA-binding transcriptional LysR family regulator
MRDLGTLDLRLLLLFDSIATLGSVSATARALDIPQPAVSQGLRRLRLLFNDELFLRASRRMEPTVLAASLRGPIGDIVRIARAGILSTPVFDPRESQREFRIAATDFGAVTLLTLLLPRLAETAPDVRLRLTTMNAGIFGDLDAGRLDLGIGIITGTAPNVRSQTVFVDRYALAMRAGHPALQGRPSAAVFRRAKYVVVTSLIGTIEDAVTILQTSVAPDQIAMRVPTYAILPAILTRTDLVALVPSTTGRTMFPGHEIAYVKPPFTLPQITVATVWHERSDADPALRWLRDEVALLFEGFGRRSVNAPTS